MAKSITFDEFHLTVLVPAGFSRTEITSVKRTLKNRRFQTCLRQAIGDVARRYRCLKSAKFRRSR